MTEEKKDRRSKRSLVLLAAKVKTPAGTVEARLRNLSQSGALLESDQPPAAGEEVVFERGETKVAGRVAWSREGKFGVEFLHPIEESEVLVHVGRPQKRTVEQPVHRRTGLKEARLSLGERRLGASWARPAGRTFRD